MSSIGVLRVTVARDQLYGTVLEQLVLAFMLNVLLVLAVIFAIFLAVRATVITPLIRLSREMEKVSLKVPDSAMITVPGGHEDDQIGVVAQAARTFIQSAQDFLLQRDRADRDLRRVQKLESIGQLTSGIAHDFNNLLGIIIGNLDFLSRMTKEQPAMQARIDTAMRGALRGENLVKKLLNFSSRSNGPVTTNSLSTLFEGMKPILERALGPELEFEASIAPDLWLVDLDAADVENCLLNMAINARDAMEAGGTFRVSMANKVIEESQAGQMSGLNSGDYVHLSFSDTGHGIPDAIVDKIFDPFFTTKAENGTGLGLSMIYGFVIRCEGAIKVYSHQSVGTTFHIYLPRSHAEDTSAAFEPPQTDMGLPGGSEHVLIADDEADLAEVAMNWLEEAGYSTTVVGNAKEALAALKVNPSIDVLFTDIIMSGGMNGIELSNNVRREFPNVCILVTSGFLGDAHVNAYHQNSKFSFQAKPYSHLQLLRKIRTVLTSSD